MRGPAKRVPLPLLAAMAALSPAASAAQDPMPACDRTGFFVGAGPALLSDSEGDRSLGARLRLAGCRTGHVQVTGPEENPNGFPMSYVLLATGNYLLASGGVVSPESNEVRAGAGLSVSLSRPERVAPRSVPPQCLPYYDGGGFYWGFAELVATGAYQANVDRSERMLTGGAELRYARTGTGWSRLVPSLVLRAEAVEPTHSEARAALGIGDESDAHGRLQARAYWYAPLPGHLTLQVDAEAFRASGLDEALAALGWTDGERVAATLRWDGRIPLGPFLHVGSPYARYAYGQEPTGRDDEHVFTAGFSVGFGRRDGGLAGEPQGPTLTEARSGALPEACG